MTSEELSTFVNTYCEESVKLKKDKMAQWSKIYCEKCKKELNG